jgi:adenylate kinase family enzyme
MKKITLLWGLPGSGKSHYSKSIENKRENFILDMDSFKAGDIKSLVSSVEYHLGCFSHIILDGLVTTNAAADLILRKIEEMAKQRQFSIQYEIAYWMPNIERCLWNDTGRRKIDSKITIKNMKVEEPSKELLTKYNISLFRKDIVKKPVFKHWINTNNIDIDEKNRMQSSTWSLGGTSGNCWDDEEYEIDPEPQPICFKEFDELIECVCPKIGFMKYKKIHNECVSVETESHGDYYGGSTTEAFFVCDVKKLYEMLLEEDLIKEEE